MKFINFLSLIALPFVMGLELGAQTLTPEQQATLDSLPPGIREQALQELKTLSVTHSPNSGPLELPELLTQTPDDEDEEIETDDRFAKEFAKEMGETNIEEKAEERVIEQALEPYGYAFFSGTPTTFAPVSDIPVTSDFVIGPGDQIRINLYGGESGSYELYVSRDGTIQLPIIGPIAIAGQTLDEFRQNLSRQVADQMMNTEAFVTLGELRSIRVFVLGDVNHPGSYTVSSLSTMINALWVSGGISHIGSLRRIQLKRSGKVETELDLYDFLLNGDNSADARLQPGDVLFVPPVGPRVGVSGEAKRPAIYELKSETTIEEILRLSGGATASAYLPITQIERVATSGLKEIVDVDLTDSVLLQEPLQDGDLVRLFPSLDRADNVVTTEGHVSRPGNYQWKDGIRVTDIIKGYQDILPSADLEYSLVVSKNRYNGRISVQSFSLEKAFKSPRSTSNPILSEKDRILVFDESDSDRTGLIEIVEKLKSQATSRNPQLIVEVSGHVRHPGEYPLENGMTVSNLVNAAGGFSQEAFTLEAELMRFADNDKNFRETILIPVNINNINGQEDIDLRSFDQLLIKKIPKWDEKETIELVGEVRFPGTYTIEKGERLSSAIARAGGLSELAYPQAAVFLRESLKETEAVQIRKLRERLQEDIATASLEEDAVTQSSVETAEDLAEQLDNTEALGRLVIDLESVLSEEKDIILKNGDQLIIPQEPQSVTIIGSVNHPTSHFYDGSLDRNDYIGLSGGLLQKADKKRIYIVRANGRVIAEPTSKFFPKSNLQVLPGDTIVVPVDVDRMKPLRYWSEVSRVIYQVALGVAAVNSL